MRPEEWFPWAIATTVMFYGVLCTILTRRYTRKNSDSARSCLRSHTSHWGMSHLNLTNTYRVKGEDMTPLLTLANVFVDRSWEEMDKRGGCVRLYIEHAPGQYYEHFVPSNCSPEVFRRAVAYLVDCLTSNPTPPIYPEFR